MYDQSVSEPAFISMSVKGMLSSPGFKGATASGQVPETLVPAPGHNGPARPAKASDPIQ